MGSGCHLIGPVADPWTGRHGSMCKEAPIIDVVGLPPAPSKVLSQYDLLSKAFMRSPLSVSVAWTHALWSRESFSAGAHQERYNRRANSYLSTNSPITDKLSGLGRSACSACMKTTLLALLARKGRNSSIPRRCLSCLLSRGQSAWIGSPRGQGASSLTTAGSFAILR